MIEEYNIIEYDFSVFFDLAIIVLGLFVCMIGFSFWLKSQKRRLTFCLITWSLFVGMVFLGVVCLVSTIQTQRLFWLGYFAQTAKSYAGLLMQFESWKIQIGDEELFSEWSDPVSPEPVHKLTEPNDPQFRVDENASLTTLKPKERFAVPTGLTAQIGAKTLLLPDQTLPMLRRNQWGVVALTGDNQAFNRCTKQITLHWNTVAGATTYRLQWGNKNAIQSESDWYDVYSGSKPYCVLTAPDHWEIV
ncbi:MAG: hypothetical protein LBQ50_01375, partial [Planctomycetaceae bacterium]|nr:hypothetical protein [Planctomycetaceae bacterium]